MENKAHRMRKFRADMESLGIVGVNVMVPVNMKRRITLMATVLRGEHLIAHAENDTASDWHYDMAERRKRRFPKGPDLASIINSAKKVKRLAHRASVVEERAKLYQEAEYDTNNPREGMTEEELAQQFAKVYAYSVWLQAECEDLSEELGL